MRLKKLQDFLQEKGWKYQYIEENDCASLDFEHRGLTYHVWEFLEEEYGAESNVVNVGRMQDYSGAYEDEILSVLQTW